MPDPHLLIGIIGGTGLGEALGAQRGQTHQIATPFGDTSSPIVRTSWEGVEVAILQRHGPGHLLSPTQVPYRANIFALKSLGVTHIVASGATGSLREHINPGDIVLPHQVIDRTSRRPATFYERAAVHVEFADPFCPVTRGWLRRAAEGLDGVKVHDTGTYVCMEGPAFSTRAESHLHRAWGGDLIGMTCMPEAKLAREAEIAYALVALPTDYDCWRPRNSRPDNGAADHSSGDAQELLKEIMSNLQTATQRSVALIQAALRDMSPLLEHPSPAHDALKLAIWSDRQRIDEAELQRLWPLWGRHFVGG